MQTIIAKALIRTMIAVAILAVVMFVSAGTLRWPAGWVYLAILIAGSVLPLCGPFQFDPALIEERMSRHPDAKKWDRIFVALVALLTPAELVVPGLDHRWKWTGPMPHWTMWAGAVGVAVGTAGLIWAMRTNRFFSAVIRIQRERGHQVVVDGPYRLVRHPGYAFWMLQSISVPLLFKSLWTFLPVGLLIVMLIIRTALEDRVLHLELSGYSEYAMRVKAKLVPGIW
jgi:protein-S-isoprenylcysteine O-methyltransferase Ste14